MTNVLDPGRRHVASTSSTRLWQGLWGAGLIITGILAVLLPELAALASALVLGWLLVFGGVFEIAYALNARRLPGFGWKLASGLLTFLLGALIVFYPLAGVESLTLLIGVFLLAAGLTRTALGLQLRRQRGSGWVLLDGALSIVLAVLIVVGWPDNSVPFLGVLTGLTLISTGVWRIILR